VNTKKYIASGIIEKYVLGQASVQEQKEVECLSSIYPEIKEALQNIESDLLVTANAFAQEPPKELKDDILAAIQGIPQEESDQELIHTQKESDPTPVKAQAKEIPISGARLKGQRWMTAASIAASVIILAGAFWFNDRMERQYEDQLGEVERQRNILYDQLVQTQSRSEQQIEALAKAQTIKVKLNPVAEESGQDAVVFWDQLTQNVYLNPAGLATPPSGKQYQLWALIDGNPVDLGVFDWTNQDAVLAMNPIKDADAFAITLEPEGGRPSPSLDQLQVLGELQG
jgi:anti-sigma-K factor RskA